LSRDVENVRYDTAKKNRRISLNIPGGMAIFARIGYFLAMASVSVASDTEEITSSENGGQNSRRIEWEELSSLITQVPVGRFVPYLQGK